MQYAFVIHSFNPLLTYITLFLTLNYVLQKFGGMADDGMGEDFEDSDDEGKCL